jgi:hypothetical protein
MPEAKYLPSAENARDKISVLSVRSVISSFCDSMLHTFIVVSRLAEISILLSFENNKKLILSLCFFRFATYFYVSKL